MGTPLSSYAGRSGCSHSLPSDAIKRIAAKRREVNELALKSKLRSVRRLIPLATALLLAALVAVPSSGIARAQSPPDELTLVNADRDFVERKKGGEFVARPIFDREIADLFYAVRDADTGDWISAMYRVKGGEKKRSDGWEYSWEYPDLDDHPDLDRDRAYLLVMLAVAEDGKREATSTPSSPSTNPDASGTRF